MHFLSISVGVECYGVGGGWRWGRESMDEWMAG